MYQPLSFEEIRANILAEYRNKIAGADISVGSEIYARASVFAAGCSLLSYGLVYVERQIFPDTADTGNLEHHAALYDLERKEPTAATGQILLTGTNGTVVSSGLTLVHADGTEFTTTSGGTIASGELAVNAAAAVGSAGNRITGDALTVQSPPAGVDAEAEVSGDFSGGTDDETDDALRARVLARMRAGNAGGRASDYEQWALAIDGVVAA
ncbi:MAG TPA: baseplate J/gp47 family protein, partial [Myxococcota bacterium]|nr:baseplate J/gp47 family protein [Myxococcota bacterium]